MPFRPAPRARTTESAFTLIELMVAVCIIGVLASVAIPGYDKYIKNAQGSEAMTDIGVLYRGAAAYFQQPRVRRGNDPLNSFGTNCVVPEDPTAVMNFRPDFPPTAEKRTYDFAGNPYFQALGFSKSTPAYFSLSWMTRGYSLPAVGMGGVFGTCQGLDGPAYIFFALADVDGDGRMGGYSLGASVLQGQLARNIGFGSIATGLEGAGLPPGAFPFLVPDID